MENVHYSRGEFQKCPFHSQQQNDLNNTVSDNDNTKKSSKPDETGTDPKRYEPDKFEKSPNEKSGGDGSTESAAKKLNNL